MVREELLKSYYQNEYDANKQMAKALGAVAGFLFLLWILYLIPPIFALTKETRTITIISLPIVIVIMMTPLFWVRRSKEKKVGFKYFVLITFIFAMAVLNVIIPKHAILGWALCIVLTNHYYNPKVGLIVFIITLLAMLVAIYMAMFLGEYDPNLLMGELDDKTGLIHHYTTEMTFYDSPGGRLEFLMYLKSIGHNRFVTALEYYYGARAAVLSLIFFVSNALNKRTRSLLIEQIEISRANVNQSKELEIASHIQLSALPTAFFSNKDFEVVAGLQAAKEVGGDFYDYYLLDENHVAVLIGDVSGKGTPAAMFMMKTITCFKNFTKSGKKPSEIMSEVNKAINEGNEDMFVTCFLGILDLQTGEMVYANAGHNPPVIKHDGKYQFLKCSSGFILGALPQAVVKDETLVLDKGDLIMLYTDGITEARNEAGDFYGEQRFIDDLNKGEFDSVIELLYETRERVEGFAGNCPQSDDMTSIVLKYKDGKVAYREIFLDAKVEKVNELIKKTEKFFAENGLKPDNRYNIILDEIFSNIAKYAYRDSTSVESVYIRLYYNAKKGEISFTFVDRGIPFNQMDRESELVDENFENRKEGGLGIHLVKQFVDSYKYNRLNDKNVLVLKKQIQSKE